MDAVDAMLFALLALGDLCLVIHLHRRRQRRFKLERMMRALRRAIHREIGVQKAAPAPIPALAFQRVS